MTSQEVRAEPRLRSPERTHPGVGGQGDALDALRSAGFSTIIDSFPEGAVLFFDHDLRYLRAGGVGLADVGFSPELLEGRTLFDAVPHHVAAAVEPSYRQALAGQASSLDVHFGDRVFLQLSSPLFGADGVVVAGMTFTRDVTADRRAERALSESEEMFRMAFDHGPIGMALMSTDFRYLQVNQAMCELTGYSRAELRDMSPALLTHPDDLASSVDRGVGLLAGDTSAYVTEKRFVKASGEVIWVTISASLARRQDGSPLNIIAQVQDITERKDYEQVLAEERRRLCAAQSIGRIGSWELDLATDTVTWSDTLSELYGLAPGDFPATQGSSTNGVHPDDVDQLKAALDACAKDGTPLSNRHRVCRFSDRELRWFDTRAARHQDGDRFRLAGVVIDVTEQVLAETRLEHAALHDGLTGLPNRRLVADRLARALDRSEREGQVAVLFCNLDGFKRVNDVHGHRAGDAVLLEAAARVVAATRSGDTVGRMGGDEFVVVCGVPRGENPAAVAELVVGRIEGAMSEPILFDGLEHRVTFSTGICLADQGDNADLVLRQADVAMYLAKTLGKDGHATFDASLASDVVDRDSIERQIRVALADDTLEVYYQPIVEPATGRIRAVEALLRVPDGAGWYLDALESVLVAERVGIIAAIDERVLRLACAQVAVWRQQPGHGELAVSVNRSAIDIARPGLFDRITAVVADSGLDPGALTIEITETVLLDAAPGTITDLVRLRADGIGIAIDDFGTGYASLHYLATLPITSLKVDSSFTAGLPDDQTCATIVSATVGLAADLGLGCVVEGVETIEQLNALPPSARLLIQGYLYARPEAPQAELPTHLTMGGGPPTGRDRPLENPGH